MNPPRLIEKTFKKEFAQELMGIAEGDLKSAVALSQSSEGRKENICYLAEQAIEKCLKAVLCHLGYPVPLIHDLGLLIGRIPAEQQPPYASEIINLTIYATIRRYEEGPDSLTSKEIMASIKLAEDVLGWANHICDRKK